MLVFRRDGKPYSQALASNRGDEKTTHILASTPDRVKGEFRDVNLFPKMIDDGYQRAKKDDDE